LAVTSSAGARAAPRRDAGVDVRVEPEADGQLPRDAGHRRAQPPRGRRQLEALAAGDDPAPRGHGAAGESGQARLRLLAERDVERLAVEGRLRRLVDAVRRGRLAARVLLERG
jgi:hypothetical protein